MNYPDLYIFPEDHPPSPYNQPVSIFWMGEGFMPKGLRLCAVGWLENPGFSTGQVPDECMDALVAAYRGSKLFQDGTRGDHGCSFCDQSISSIQWRGQTIKVKAFGHYLLQMDKIVYMSPAFLLHYICEHHYCPPQEFIYATIHGKFLSEDDLDIKWDNTSYWNPGPLSKRR